MPGAAPDVCDHCNLAKVFVGIQEWCTLAAMHPPTDVADLSDAELLATVAMPHEVLRLVAKEMLVRLVPRQPIVGARGRSPPRARAPPRVGFPDEVPLRGTPCSAAPKWNVVVVWAKDMQSDDCTQYSAVLSVDTIAYPGSLRNWARVTVEIADKARSRTVDTHNNMHTLWLDFSAKTRQAWVDVLYAVAAVETARQRTGYTNTTAGFNPVEYLRREEPMVDDAFTVLRKRLDSSSDLDSEVESESESESDSESDGGLR